MHPVVVPHRRVPDADERWGRVQAGIWPEYTLHGNVLNRFWGRLGDEFAPFQLLLYDEPSDDVVARAYSVPCRWEGTPDGPVGGIDDVVEEAFALHERGEQPNALSALAIAVRPEFRGRGFSRILLDALRALALEHGLGALVAPVRPTWKERYPLTPIERYAAWTRDDGLPFDPWIRLHVRAGGRVLRPEPRSLGISAAVAEWEGWTGMPFPESGTYVFPHGLAPLEVDRQADVGRYWEPNVWIVHAPAA